MDDQRFIPNTERRRAHVASWCRSARCTPEFTHLNQSSRSYRLMALARAIMPVSLKGFIPGDSAAACAKGLASSLKGWVDSDWQEHVFSHSGWYDVSYIPVAHRRISSAIALQ